MKGLFKGSFIQGGGEGRWHRRPTARERRRMSDVGEVGRSLHVMGLNEMGLDVRKGDGEDEVEEDDDGAASNFGAAATVAAAGRWLTHSFTRVERSEDTGEGLGTSMRRKKLASRWRQVVESSPPPREPGMYFEAEDVGEMREQRESSVGSDTWGSVVPPSGYEADMWEKLGMEWGGPMRYEPPAEQPEVDEDVLPEMTAEERNESANLFRE